MNTKIILVGGYPRKAADGGKAFAEELVAGFTEPIKVLDCLFARPQDNWEKAYQEDAAFFQKHLPNLELTTELADLNHFIEQIRWANCIYIRGGDTTVLLTILKRWPEWTAELTGKTIAGSSAGAEAIVKYSYNLDTLTVEEGLGLLPVKFVPHWDSDYNAPNVDWDKVKVELENYEETLPLILLKEGEFKTFDVQIPL